MMYMHYIFHFNVYASIVLLYIWASFTAHSVDLVFRVVLAQAGTVSRPRMAP